jgi:GNAT superfamily N-acetyltransferase
VIIRPYHEQDEVGWLRCRVLAFLDTSYFDNVLTQKETYDNPSIELVAEMDGEIVGLIDVEYEQVERSVCSRGNGLGGMIWHIAVHPDYRRQGIGEAILLEAEKQAKELGINRFEAWTRDDKWINQWYEKQQFLKVDGYYHVFMEHGNEFKGILESSIPKLYPVTAFAHYLGKDVEFIKSNVKRVHECNCYEKTLLP